MAQAFEGRQRRDNGSLRSHASHVREDMATLQKDIGQLRNDLGALVALQWNALGERVSGGAAYVGEQVRTRPIAALGVAAGIGFLAGYALMSANSRKH
jgi:ElaB/YqjD/DUF883 family membrane-anchored ribosome-binding protein